MSLLRVDKSLRLPQLMSITVLLYDCMNDLLCVFFYLVFAMPLCASVNMCLVVTYWERADLLALFCGV